MKLGFNELGYNEHSVLANKIFIPKLNDHLLHETPQLLTNPGYKEQIWSVQSRSLLHYIQGGEGKQHYV